jgi:hypothetical protein
LERKQAKKGKGKPTKEELDPDKFILPGAIEVMTFEPAIKELASTPHLSAKQVAFEDEPDFEIVKPTED